MSEPLSAERANLVARAFADVLAVLPCLASAELEGEERAVVFMVADRINRLCTSALRACDPMEKDLAEIYAEAFPSLAFPYTPHEESAHG